MKGKNKKAESNILDNMAKVLLWIIVAVILGFALNVLLKKLGVY